MSTVLIMAVMHRFIRACQKKEFVIYILLDMNKFRKNLLIDTHGAEVCDRVWELLIYIKYVV
jgi:uncharacterized protein (UPF0276 family)